MITDEQEYGSEHRKVMTILAKSIKENMPVLQISDWIDMPVLVRER